MVVRRVLVDPEGPLASLHAVVSVERDDIVASSQLTKFIEDNQHLPFLRERPVGEILEEIRSEYARELPSGLVQSEPAKSRTSSPRPRRVEPSSWTSVADPAPLGLAAFALTTFLLSMHNAFGSGTTPLLAFFGPAIFYGGLTQFMAGMWEFRRGNVFASTAFSTYGAFWMGLAAFVALILFGKVPTKEVTPSLAWILFAFAVFNTYMLVWSSRINMAVFLVFLTLEATEILLVIGNLAGNAAGTGVVAVGGVVGIITAAVAWYASAAGVVNGMSATQVLPVGMPLFGAAARAHRPAVPREV